MPRRERLRRGRRSKGRCQRLRSLRPAPLADAHFRQLIERFHRLGPRVLGELLSELGAQGLLRTTIETRLEEYVARLDRGLLGATGGAELVALRPWLVPPNRDTPQPEDGK